ncbi:MAG TPA: AI-2E family transporter [Chitinophagaceae bacterium]|nr:AI-2E family transporter [Chitinophagaceae bacterium]
MSKTNTGQVVRIACILLIIILLVYIAAYLKIVIVPLLFSLIFAVMLYPMCKKLEYIGLTKGLAAFTSVFLTSVVLGFVIYFAYSQVIRFAEQGPQFLEKASDLYDKFQAFVADTFGVRRSSQPHLQQQLAKFANNTEVIVSGVVGFLSGFITDVTLIPLYVFFLLYFRDFFLEFFYKIIPSSDKEVIDLTMNQIYDVILKWMRGILIVIVIVGVLNSMGLVFLGIEYPFFFGFLASFLALIPYIGILIGSLLPALLALITKDSYWYAVGVIGIFWFIQILEGNLITPYIVGKNVSLNPLIAIFSLLLLGKLWGLAGLVLALPVTAIIKVVFDSVPVLKPYGFLLGEPQAYHLKRHSRLHIKRLTSLKLLRKKKLTDPPADTGIKI